MPVFTQTRALQIKSYSLQGLNSIKHIKHVHAALLRLGLNHDSFLLNRLLRYSFEIGETNYPCLVFSQIEETNIILWNTMIRGLVSNNRFKESIDFYHSMRENGFLPNGLTFPFVLKTCVGLLDFQVGSKMHTLVLKMGFNHDVFVDTGLVNFYAGFGHIECAFKVFADVPEKNMETWTPIINEYIRVGKRKEAIDMFRRLLEMGVRPDSFTLVRILSACIQIGDLRSGEW
uniref:Pentatricopeptide repeat-containing protein n=1 Tax=Rhizophora mucronata TaxID=61149 RepID=A0A2P2Q658_RHIMU